MAHKAMKEIRNLAKAELSTKERELQAALFDAKMKKVTGQLGNPNLTWKLRKDLARVKTLQTQQGKK